jgi:tRNA 2-thiouridine synthesizing protein A
VNAAGPRQPSDADPPKDAPNEAQPPRPVGAGDDDQATVLDCRGQRCPLPVIALAKRLPTVPIGDAVTVLADDPAAAVDIPAWCRMRAQRFVAATVIDGAPAYTVQRLT